MNHRVVELRNIIGLAAGRQILIGDIHFIDPVAAGVANVGLQRRPRSQAASANDVSFDQRPRRMTNRRDRLARIKERPHEPHGFLIHTQLVGVCNAARK
jgi:hypothetical protein